MPSLKTSRFLGAAILVFSGLSGLSALPAQSADLKCAQMPVLFDAFLERHYSVRKLTPEVESRTVDQFIKAVDGSKTLLLQEDVDRIRKDLPGEFEAMRKGDCSKLDAIGQLLISRTEEDEAFVKDFVGPKYKLDLNTEFISDPDKRQFSKTADERHALVKKLVHFQISSYLMTHMKLPEAKKQLVHRYELFTKRMKEEKSAKLPEIFAESFAVALDPHSQYMSQDTLEEFQISMRLSLEGIGASLSNQDGFTVIEELIPGGSAARMHVLRPKDKIIAVAQDGKKAVSVIDMDLPEVVKMIRGKKGTKVKLSILRKAGEKSETFDVTIVRDKIDIKEQAAKINYENRKVGGKTYKIGIIDLPSFYGGDKGARSSYRDMKNLLEQAKAKKVDGIVLDLSKNGGGLLDEAVKIAGLFIKKGAVVATKDADKNVQILSDEDPDTVYNGPLEVLISHMSASASEILTGALKDYHRALIVGSDHSFGKGSVQVVQDLPANLGAMKVTMAMFFLPGGVSTQTGGVTSDIQVPSIFNGNDIGEKFLDYALPTQTIDSFLSKDVDDAAADKRWEPITETMVPKLATASKDRIAKNPAFKKIQKEIDDAAKNKGMIKLSELRKKPEPTSPKKEKEHVKSLEQPVVDEAVNIMADLIGEMPAPATAPVTSTN